MKNKLAKTAVAVSFLFPALSNSQDYSFTNGNFYIKPLVGTEFSISGDAVKASSISQTGATTLDFADGTVVTAAVAGQMDVPEVSYDEVFEQSLSFGGEIGYFVTDDINLYFKVNSVDADAKAFVAATATVNATITFDGNASNYIAGGTLLEGKFSDYNEVSFMFGANKQFEFDNNFSLHLGGGLGFSSIDKLDLTVSELISGNKNNEKLKYTKDSTVFAGEINTGAAYNINQFAFGLNLNYKYKGSLERDTTDFNFDNLETLEKANDAEVQHVFGLMGSISYRF